MSTSTYVVTSSSSLGTVGGLSVRPSIYAVRLSTALAATDETDQYIHARSITEKHV